MNSAPLPDPSLPLPKTSRWDDVRRIYRRICVLRATGRAGEAGLLERTELSPALDSVGVVVSPDSTAAVLAEEESRVADAQLLADLMVPLLAERLRPLLTAATAASVPDRPPRAAPRAAPPPAAGVPSVADLIEGMLTQDRALAAPPAR